MMFVSRRNPIMALRKLKVIVQCCGHITPDYFLMKTVPVTLLRVALPADIGTRYKPAGFEYEEQHPV